MFQPTLIITPIISKNISIITFFLLHLNVISALEQTNSIYFICIVSRLAELTFVILLLWKLTAFTIISIINALQTIDRAFNTIILIQEIASLTFNTIGFSG
ncbi:unnamed protein product [Paramecium octaurelia]|uniref:Uncharacterized protein n=1 Tax=Paramecium octaurelia TaxID=43137 RepID=A0A8S1XZ34_PAROT|nr:unnamed protein product [Paramecium octaurelia]